MTLLDAVIFDLDGVLVDTIAMHEQAWQEVAQVGGRNLSHAETDQLRGLRRDECLQLIFPDADLSADQINDLLTIKNDAYIQAISKRNPHELLTPNALELIHAIRKHNLKLGLASSSVNASVVLEHVGIASLFDIIAGGKAVSRSKPQPDIFVWVAGALQVFPQHVLVFEDSVAGITAAKQAGMHVVGVANPLAQHHADHYFNTLSQINFDDLLVSLDSTLPHQRSLIGDQNVRN